MEEKTNDEKKDGIEIPLDEFDDYFEGPGFIMARKGRFILSQSTLSGDERRAFLQNILDHQEEFKASIEQQVIELENVLQQYNPFDVLGNVSLLNSIHDVETYKEYEHPETPAFTEYLSLLLLTKPFDHYAARTPRPISGKVIEDIQKRIQSLFTNQLFFLAFKDIDPKQEQPDILQELRFQTLLRSIGVRALTYHHHLVDLLRELFLPLEDELSLALGFDIDDNLIIAGSIEAIMNQKLSERREQGISFERELQIAVKRYRHKKRVTENYSEDMLEHLASLRPREAKEKIRNLAMAWMFFGIGDTLSFTIDDLLTQAKVEPDKVRNFLIRFSIRFSEVDSTRYRFPAPTHPLTTKPIIEHGSQYFCPVPQLLYWGMRQAIEEMLNPNNPDAINRDALRWERYEKVRANFVEDKAIEYLEQALNHAKAYKKLKYHISENGENKEVELDGLLLLNSALFLVEVKAGTMSLPARRGAKKRMIEELTELVEEAYGQALRAKRYITETDKPTFTLPDGASLEIDKDGLNNIFMITVTLEHLDAFVTNLYKLQELGFIKQGDYPWAVSLSDLRVISEVVATSCEFVHFLFRRAKLNELGAAEAHDELDWFGHYIQEGLYFESDENSGQRAHLNLLSYTTPFDDYYFYITGQRKTPAEKPRQPMPEVMRQVIEELETAHQDGYLKAASVLLDMDGKTREDFAEYFINMRKKTIKDRGFHDFSIPFSKADFGITCMFSGNEKASELGKRLQNYCLIKKYAMKIKTWVGFGCVVDSKNLVSFVFINANMLEQNAKLDKLLEIMPHLRDSPK